MIKKIILLALGVCSLSLGMSAQTLPILTLGGDMRSSGMAGVAPARGSHANIYSSVVNPFYGDATRLAADYLAGIHTTKASGLATYHQATATYALSSGRALSLGWRYLGGMQTDYLDAHGNKIGVVHPRDWSLDLGYSHLLDNNWLGWGRIGYLQSYNSAVADVVTASAGVAYRSERIDALPSYMVGLSIENFGTKVKYAKSEISSNQPTLVRLSGSISLLESGSLTLGGGATYHLATAGEKKFGYYVGGEWQPIQMFALRTGYSSSPNGNVWSVGAGFSYNSISLDLAYNLHEHKLFNMLKLGLAYRL
ncbi:MAG: PorV/PorQ family protein [Porphyromonadaceae bacterium]|nr:PorV/PorQ family protein [Porphyromonadaceae bacterium]